MDLARMCTYGGCVHTAKLSQIMSVIGIFNFIKVLQFNASRQCVYPAR